MFKLKTFISYFQCSTVTYGKLKGCTVRKSINKHAQKNEIGQLYRHSFKVYPRSLIDAFT